MPSSSSFAQLLKSYRALGHHSHSHQQQSVSLTSLEQLQVVDVSFSRAFQRLQAAMERREVRLRQLLQQSRARARHRMSEVLNALPTMVRPASQQQQQPQQQAPDQALLQAEQLPRLNTQPSTLDQTPATPSSSLPVTLDELLGTNGWLRHTVLSGVAHLSHAFMNSANTVHVEGGEIMRSALARPQGQALITVCNHVAALDDPLVVSTVIPPELYSQPSALRWTLCATDRCFKYAALAPFFTAAKVLPVQRGAGLQQPGMQAAEGRLAAGDWVHIFPEGTRSRDPEQLGPVRKGVGRLVVAAAAAAPPGTPPPLVVPFVHAGMEKVMPVGSKVPRIGQEVRVVVGEPIPVDDLLSQAAALGWADDVVYTAIAARVEQRLQEMHASVWHPEQRSTISTSSAVPSATDAGTPGAGLDSRQLIMGGGVKGGSSWGLVGQQVWDRMAFSIWHRVWAARATIARLSEEAYATGLPLGLWEQQDEEPVVPGPRSMALLAH